MHEPWKIIRREVVYSGLPWISVEQHEVELPDGTRVPDYHRVVIPAAAGVVAELGDGRVVFQRQYRHGVGRVALFLPGGMLAKGEEPLAGAQRELREETGYEATRWRSLGDFAMNANYGCGHMHLFHASGLRLVARPDSGDLEATEIALLRRGALRRALARGEVGSIAAVAALLLALPELASPAAAKSDSRLEC